MKKYFKGLFVLAFALMMFIPMSVLAEEKMYEYFNFKVDMVNGEKIKDTKVKIYASIEGDEKNLIDRTDEFNVEELMWSVCDVEDCSTVREIEDDAVFDLEKGYLFMIRITAKNGADINVWGTDKAMFNGTPIEELYGEYGNTGKELMIKSKIAEEKVKPQENTLTEETKEEPKQEEVKTTGEEKTCMLGLSLCCTTFLGISICIWILIAILIILLIIIFCVLKGKKKKEDQPVQQ